MNTNSCSTFISIFSHPPLSCSTRRCSHARTLSSRSLLRDLGCSPGPNFPVSRGGEVPISFDSGSGMYQSPLGIANVQSIPCRQMEGFCPQTLLNLLPAGIWGLEIFALQFDIGRFAPLQWIDSASSGGVRRVHTFSTSRSPIR